MTTQIHSILAKRAVSISEFKKNPIQAVIKAEDAPLVILSHNKPAFYCMSNEVFKEYQILGEINKNLIEKINNLKHDKLILERINTSGVKVTIDEL